MARFCVWSRNFVHEEAIALLEGCEIQTHNGVVAPVEKKCRLQICLSVRPRSITRVLTGRSLFPARYYVVTCRVICIKVAKILAVRSSVSTRQRSCAVLFTNWSQLSPATLEAKQGYLPVVIVSGTLRRLTDSHILWRRAQHASYVPLAASFSQLFIYVCTQTDRSAAAFLIDL